MTLLLGPPGSGKTTLMLALAGKLSKDLRMKGKISYNGRELHEFVPQRTAAYISQVDVHTAELTVRETFDFAARMQGPGFRAGEGRLAKSTCFSRLGVLFRLSLFAVKQCGKRDGRFERYTFHITGAGLTIIG